MSLIEVKGLHKICLTPVKLKGMPRAGGGRSGRDDTEKDGRAD